MTEVGNIHGEAPLAIILPHSESFQPAGAGAVTFSVRDYSTVSRMAPRIRILGSEVSDPFDAARFVPVAPAPWWHGRRGARYIQGVISVLRELSPAYIEVHNRPVYVPALRKAFPDTPLVLYLHNDPRTMRGIREVAQRARCLEQVSAVVCLSDFIRRCMLEGVEDHPRSANVRVVMNGVDTAALIPDEHKRREIVFIGRLSPQKGGLLFAQAALKLKDSLPDWRFVLVGSRDFRKSTMGSDYEREVILSMQRLGVQGEVTGYLPREEVLGRFKRAAIAVVPSLWDEPFGLVVVEAMTAGCAVVASRRGGIPEIVDDAGVLIESGDVATWSEQLLRIAKDGELQRRCQHAARNRAVQCFDIHRTVASLDAIRLELIDKAREKDR
jgi:UDP-glucose:(glucosyl)LPS alpha-1,2-glucosyltransferase